MPFTHRRALVSAHRDAVQSRQPRESGGPHENISPLKRAEKQAIAQSIRLAETFSRMVGAIALSIEKRDPYTAGHQRQVATIAVEIGRVMQLSEDQLFGLHLGATIHDIGKISFPAEILSRPGKLSEPEYAIIRYHPVTGQKNCAASISFGP